MKLKWTFEAISMFVFTTLSVMFYGIVVALDAYRGIVYGEQSTVHGR